MGALIFKAIVADGLSQVLTFAYRLILVTLFTVQFNIQIYGVFLTILAYVTFLTIVDIGFSQQIINTLTKIKSRLKLSYFKIAFNNSLIGLSLYIILIFSILVVIISISPDITYSKFQEIENIINIKELIILMLIKAMIQIPGGLILSLHRINGENFKSIMFSNFLLLALCLTSFISIYILNSLRFFLYTDIIICLIIYYINLKYFIDKKIIFFPTLSKFNFLALKMETRGALGFFKIMLSNYANTSGIILLISSFYGNQTVAIFSTTRMIIGLMTQAVGMANHALWPEITRLFAKKNLIKINLLMHINSIISAFIAGNISLILIRNENLITSLWFPFQELVDKDLLRIFLITSSPLLLLNIYSNFMMATNKHLEWSNIFLAQSFINIIIIYLYVVDFGLNSTFLILGIFGTAVLGLYQVISVAKLLKIHMTYFIVVDAIITTIIIYLISFTFISSWFILIILITYLSGRTALIWKRLNA